MASPTISPVAINDKLTVVVTPDVYALKLCKTNDDKSRTLYIPLYVIDKSFCFKEALSQAGKTATTVYEDKKWRLSVVLFYGNQYMCYSKLDAAGAVIRYLLMF